MLYPLWAQKPKKHQHCLCSVNPRYNLRYIRCHFSNPNFGAEGQELTLLLAPEDGRAIKIHGTETEFDSFPIILIICHVSELTASKDCKTRYKGFTIYLGKLHQLIISYLAMLDRGLSLEMCC